MGLLSSLFLAAGLARVAQHLDPSGAHAEKASPFILHGGSPPCLLPCDQPPEH